MSLIGQSLANWLLIRHLSGLHPNFSAHHQNRSPECSASYSSCRPWGTPYICTFSQFKQDTRTILMFHNSQFCTSSGIWHPCLRESCSINCMHKRTSGSQRAMITMAYFNHIFTVYQILPGPGTGEVTNNSLNTFHESINDRAWHRMFRDAHQPNNSYLRESTYITLSLNCRFFGLQCSESMPSRRLKSLSGSVQPLAVFWICIHLMSSGRALRVILLLPMHLNKQCTHSMMQSIGKILVKPVHLKVKF